MKYKITEIFKSLQGEGLNLGKEVIFVRLAGCNLNCKWCDTNYNIQEELTDTQIIKRIKDLNCSNVIFTGGEPTTQNILPLIRYLKRNWFWVGIETNGTNDLSEIRGCIEYITCSPKKESKIHNSIRLVDEIRIVNDNLSTEEVLTYEPLGIKNKYISVLDNNGKFNLKETIDLLGEVNERVELKWRLNQQYHKQLKIL